MEYPNIEHSYLCDLALQKYNRSAPYQLHDNHLHMLYVVHALTQVKPTVITSAIAIRFNFHKHKPYGNRYLWQLLTELTNAQLLHREMINNAHHYSLTIAGHNALNQIERSMRSQKFKEH